MILIAVGVILTAIAVLGIRGCISKQRPIIITQGEKIKDSVDDWYSKAQKVIDSLTTRLIVQTAGKDSLRRISDKKDHLLEMKNLKISDMVEEARLYRKYGDDTAYLHACDTILPKVAELTEAVQDGQINKRSMQDSYDSLLSTTSFKIAKLDYEQSVLKENFDKIATNAIQLEKANTILSKPKRWGIGSIVGYGFNGSKAQPFVGIGLTYNILRF